ncbi:WbqC family protein [Rhizobacter sp. Root404]|uniref:WbqC family protein n=1 Tax=Rhizobacter sp. Root404 TaxID=1736528 RepID=UPI00138F50E5|nr:WbqC family protein [Rhizobacter sp. Root404]
MQPTYMPWAGYLNLMTEVDLFVYLDEVQYERASWQNRNRVLVGGQPVWLTVPVVRDFLGAPINLVHVDERLSWRRKHAALLKQAYARHPFVADMLETTAVLDNVSLTRVAELNIAILDQLRSKLGITTPTVRSSEFSIDGMRSDRLLSILAHVEATEYVTPPGSLDYLREDNFAGRSSARLLVHQFQPTPYAQRGTESFFSHLSILDVVAHLGWHGASSYIRPSVSCVRDFEE